MVLLTWPIASMSPQRIGITISSVSFLASGSSNRMSAHQSTSNVELAVQPVDEPLQPLEFSFRNRHPRSQRRQLAHRNDRLAVAGGCERGRVDGTAEQMRPTRFARARRARQLDRQRTALLLGARR